MSEEEIEDNENVEQHFLDDFVILSASSVEPLNKMYMPYNVYKPTMCLFCGFIHK